MKNFLTAVLLTVSFTGFAQNYNQTAIDETSGKTIFVGYMTWKAFEDSSVSWWFNSEYDLYEPDQNDLKLLDDITEKINAMNITIVLGTWCSDSRREVPRFLKILDYVGFPDEQLTMIGVDRNKQLINVDEKDIQEIEFVPTFIFYYNGMETGRITESPQETLEKDIIKIVNQSMN